MQDRKGLDPGYPVSGTWYLTPMPHSLISNLNRAFEMGNSTGVPGNRNPGPFYPASCILHPCTKFDWPG